MTEPVLRRARPEDVSAIEGLLKAEWLPPFQVAEFLETFWVLEEDGRVAGSAGLEVYGKAGMLRSVVVEPRLRSSRQGRRLVEAALEEARRQSVRRVYLFTVHAAPFFARLGFVPCPLSEFEPEVRQSWQYQGVSSRPELAANVAGMRLELAGE
jgi:amino-acid N-acetyltransferase